MDDPSTEFTKTSRPQKTALDGKSDPNMAEFVKMLARICAKRDYTKFLQDKIAKEGAES